MTAGALTSVQVSLGDIGFPYHYGVDCIEEIGCSLRSLHADRLIVVTDDNVLARHGEALLGVAERSAPIDVLSHRPGEGAKSLSNLSHDLERALAAGASRRSVVLAFGGGAPGNLAGMIAALLFRGIRLVHVPTTTVAAMDSVVSLKQAVNSTFGKNHIGTYHVPEAVYTEISFLQTLPERELRSGLCEAAKNCLAIRPTSTAELREIVAGGDLASTATLLWLLEESLTAKMSVTVEDPKEKHAGLILEYGHTVGHAVELCDQQLQGALGMSHGDAIALGMVVAAHVSAALGGLDADAVALHEDLLAALGAPTRIPERMSVEAIAEVARRDGKRGYLNVRDGELAMVLLKDIGVPYTSGGTPLWPVPLDLVYKVMEGLPARTTSLTT